MKSLLLALALFSLPVSAGPLEQASALIDKGRPRQAERILRQALTNPALKPQSLVLLTKLYNELEDYEEAVHYAKQAIRLLPEDGEAHFQFAVALRIKLQKVSRIRALFIVDDYKERFRKAIELDPKHVEARAEEIGFLMHAPGTVGGSKSEARERIEALKPIDSRRAMLLQGELAELEGRTGEAIEIYRKLLEKDAGDPDARLALALALQNTKRYKEADVYLAALLDVGDPQFALMARYQLARSRVLGQYEQQQAVEHLLVYLEMFPEVPRDLPSRSNAYWRLGNAYEQLRQLDKARQAYQRAITLDGHHKEAKRSLKRLPKG